jgi:hypothetical protein
MILGIHIENEGFEPNKKISRLCRDSVEEFVGKIAEYLKKRVWRKMNSAGREKRINSEGM